MKWKINDKEKFINPYTFIPAQKVTRKEKTDGDLTGYLVCSIYPKTPLIIPDPSRKTQDASKSEHFHYPFFRINDKPVIPGSELRGMIRSVYETVTDSCFSTAKDIEISMRIHDFNSKPGVLIKNGNKYILYEADAVCIDSGINPKPKVDYIKSFPKPKGLDSFEILDNKLIPKEESQKYYNKNEYENFSKISVSWFGNTIPRRWAGWNEQVAKYKDYAENVEGYLLMVPWNGRGTKRYDHVMIKKEEKISEFDVDEIVNRLDKQLMDYIENADKENISRFKDMRNKIRRRAEAIPIWYGKDNEENKDNQKIYLSFAQCGRKEFVNSFFNFLKHDNAKPCDDKNSLCPACQMFGFAGKESASVGKVRVGDAIYSGNTISLPEKTLSELSSPKISSVEFYLTRPNGATWWDYDDSRVKIRGRKFYWHHKPGNKSSTKEKTNRNATHEIIQGEKFTFKVFFEKVNKEELNMLKWVLCLGENKANGKKQHKLGHGKPLGYGSIKITVDEEVIRKITNQGYSLEGCGQKPDISDISQNESESIKALMIISDAEHFSQTEQSLIMYPLGDDGSNSKNSGASHQWFIGNRLESGNSKPNKPYINYTLPHYSEVQTLPKWEKK